MPPKQEAKGGRIEAAREPGFGKWLRITYARSMNPVSPGPADIRIFLDDDLIAELILDRVQDSFPWNGGTLAEGPALAKWRDFVRAYAAADIEFDYCPHHPDEGPYEDSDLAEYIQVLKRTYDARVSGRVGSEFAGDAWAAPWLAEPVERLAQYIDFLDWHRWRAVTAAGAVVEGIPLPPSLDFESKRFAYRA